MISLFVRDVTRAELLAACNAEQKLPMPLMDVSVEGLPEVDMELLHQVTQMAAHASAQLHVEFEKDGHRAPMISMYASSGRLMMWCYSPGGVSIHDVINPKEVKRLLMSAFTGLPKLRSEHDICTEMIEGMTVESVLECISMGAVQPLQKLIPECAWPEFAERLCENPGICCSFFNGEQLILKGYVLNDGERCCSVFAQEGDGWLVLGSAFRLMRQINLLLVGAYREELLRDAT